MGTSFEPELVAAAAHDLIIGLRVGETHRFVGVWSVVVDGRIFARSWRLAPDGWRARLNDDEEVTLQLGGTERGARGVAVHDDQTNTAVDAAYRSKYRTPASSRYVDDLTTGASRASTIEFVPAPGR